MALYRSASCHLCQVGSSRSANQSFARRLSNSSISLNHENPLGLPRSDAPPTMPRVQRGLPQKRPIPGIRHVIAVSSAKGGVGKSTVAANLALALARRRHRVGLLDLDVFGPSVPKLLGLEHIGEPELTQQNRLIPLRSHGISCMSMGFLAPEGPVAWRGLMVMKAVQQLLFDVEWAPNGDQLDALVVDMPPGTGDVQLSFGQLVQISGAIIVSTPQDVALVDARRGVDMFRKLHIPIFGAVLNMSHFICPACSTPHDIFGPSSNFEAVCAELDVKILARVPLDPLTSARGDSGRPVVLDAGNGVEAADAFLRLGDAVARQLQFTSR